MELFVLDGTSGCEEHLRKTAKQTELPVLMKLYWCRCGHTFRTPPDESKITCENCGDFALSSSLISI
jgi:hypothetical protein